MKDQVRATKQLWGDVRALARGVLNRKHGYEYFSDDMVSLSIEEGYDGEGRHCDKVFLRLNGGADCSTINLQKELTKDVKESLLGLGIEEVVAETVDSVDLELDARLK